MPVSEARNDLVPLVRLEWPSYTGHLGHGVPNGATFVDGVAQNGVTEAAATRLCGAIGPALRVVGPWEPAQEPAQEPAPVAPPSIPQPIEPFARASRAHRGR